MKNKVLLILLLAASLLLLTGCNNKEKKSEVPKKIELVIVDENSRELYYKKIQTNKEYLIDVLKEDEIIDLKYEEGNYGAYITSLIGIEQKNENNGMYYWSYYINDEYAESGISNCKIKNDSVYKFVYEFYGN